MRELGVIRKPCRSAEALYEQEFAKGEVSGIRFALAMPSAIIMTGEIERAQRSLEDTDA